MDHIEDEVTRTISVAISWHVVAEATILDGDTARDERLVLYHYELKDSPATYRWGLGEPEALKGPIRTGFPHEFPIDRIKAIVASVPVEQGMTIRKWRIVKRVETKSSRIKFEPLDGNEDL